jgi:metal-responsive CopG/Arc/MetJ family transcriptional regulator
MSTIKTAISIDEDLFNEVKDLSTRLNIPKSQIFSQAVQYFIDKKNNLELLKKINETYREELSEIDTDYLKAAKKPYSQIIDKW